MMDLVLEQNYEVLGILEDGEQVEDFLFKNKTDILLLDINMPKLDGLQVLQNIRDKFPGLKIIMLSSQCDGWIIKKALQLGANGYLSKHAEPEEIKLGISTVLRGEPYFCKRSFSSFIKKMSNPFSDVNSKVPQSLPMTNQIKRKKSESNFENHDEGYNKVYLHNLTIREKEILGLVINEYTTKEISEKLFISFRTVETHRKHILSKLGVKNSLSLIKYVANSDLAFAG